MTPDLRILVFPAFAALLGSLTACQGLHPVMDTATSVWESRKQQNFKPRADYDYLGVSLDGRASFLALGYRSDIISSRGPERHEFWYSAQNEMLHTVNGRIHRAIGFTVEWRAQDSSPPSWADVQRSKFEVVWSRALDVMPGYRFGQEGHLRTRPIPSPVDAPQGIPTSVSWFEDVVVSTTEDNQPWEFRQRFAVLSDQVVYSEQCLSPKVCLRLRPFPRQGNP